jgi:hypothetical protein
LFTPLKKGEKQMVKRIFYIVCLLVLVAIFSIPAQSFDFFAENAGNIFAQNSSGNNTSSGNTVNSNTGRGQNLRLRDGSCLTTGTGSGTGNASGRVVNNSGRGNGRGQGLRDGSGRTNGGKRQGLVNGVCPRGN